jgi:hypothetical protein
MEAEMKRLQSNAVISALQQLQEEKELLQKRIVTIEEKQYEIMLQAQEKTIKLTLPDNL